MDDYNGLTAAIVTGCDEKYAPLMLDLCDSLGPWRRYLHVIDVDLSAETHDKLALREVKVHTLPEGLFSPTSPPSNFHRVVFARMCLPDLFAADILMWIDADCWAQRPEAIAAYLDSAAKHPDDFTLCAILDVDYPRCLDNYWAYLQIYHEQYRTLFGRKVANSLLGKAVLSVCGAANVADVARVARRNTEGVRFQAFQAAAGHPLHGGHAHTQCCPPPEPQLPRSQFRDELALSLLRSGA